MLEVTDLYKTFNASGRRGSERVGAVDRVSFSVKQGDLFTLLGPSGCGKTTTLRCIAGLESPDSGRIRVADRVVFSGADNIRVPVSHRRFGMVFQSYAIWPHMSVFKNVSFPLEVLPRSRRPSKRVRAERVERALAAVRLDGLENRQATDLSGGQQQRLALARALVLEPPVMLLDEPLSNLDAKLREGMRIELKRLQRELGITTLYVTHDQVEALAMSNVIGVMASGSLQQVGPPWEVYQRPANHFVAEFVGASNFLTGKVTGSVDADGLAVVNTDVGELAARPPAELDSSARVVVSIRPENVTLEEADPAASSAVGRWVGVVESRIFLGESVDHIVRLGSTDLRVRGNPTVSIAEGTTVSVHVPPDGCYVMAMA